MDVYENNATFAGADMQRITRFCAVLLLVAIVLPGSMLQAQNSETITVTGFYISYPSEMREYEKILTPCGADAGIWEVVPNGAAFTALAQAYASAKTQGQLTKYGELFVEVRGRYTAYEGESHSDGVFEITELVRHSTAAADITACGSECEDIYGADSPTCLAQIDGQCGSTRNSCVTGDYLDHYEGDTATHYRWECAGSYGGDSAFCTASKVGTPNAAGAGDQGLLH